MLNIAHAVLGFVLALVTFAAQAQREPGQIIQELQKLAWQRGPTEGVIGSKAKIQIPNGFSFLDERNTRRFLEQMEDQPSGFGSLLMALEEQLVPPRLVILAGPASDLPPFEAALTGNYSPTTIVFAIANGIDPLSPALARPATAEVNAYVCQGVTCLAPLTDIQKLQEALKLPKITG